MSTTESIVRRSRCATLIFGDDKELFCLYPHSDASTYGVHWPLPIGDVAWSFNALTPILFAVVNLSLFTSRHGLNPSSMWKIGTAYSLWRDVLRPFRNANSLLVHDDLVAVISRFLIAADEESPLQPLPNLNTLKRYGSEGAGDAFASFIEARKNAGHPVTLINVPEASGLEYYPSPYPWFTGLFIYHFDYHLHRHRSHPDHHKCHISITFSSRLVSPIGDQKLK